MRTHLSGQLGQSEIGIKVSLCGWVHHRRDLGGLIFIELRDRSGIVQVVFEPDIPDAFAIAEQVRSEYILKLDGLLRIRPDGTENPELETGNIEVLASHLELLSVAETPPFQVDETGVSEELRLRHRYVDLRYPQMRSNILKRAELTRTLREFLDAHDFIDVETPMLTKATPEGARDYLVPSRTQAGHFFALPQSPQLFKQILMMGGIERYYQIVRCFRDEDLRADRQPEFTQLDIETSFMSQNQILKLMEQMIRKVFAKVMDVQLPDPFLRIRYDDAMSAYGVDRPDLRNPLRLIEIADQVKDCGFKVFATPAQDQNSRVALLRIADGVKLLTRSAIDEYTKFVGRYGARGLAYIRINDLEKGREGLQSPIIKFLTDDSLQAILKVSKAKTGDILFFGADKKSIVNAAMGALRNKIGADLNLLEDTWQPVWVVDFPMFEWDSEGKRYHALHHPFTAPDTLDLETIINHPESLHSAAYDLVLNGNEIGGGSLRINDVKIQKAVFKVLGIDEQEAEERFGFLLRALRYGCPPLGGIAFGIDRLAALMCNVGSIRDVIAFPKTQTATCPLTDAPATVDAKQLKELHIRTINREN